MREYTVKALIASGWYKDRNIDLSAIENAYKEEKIQLLDCTKEFLRRFGDFIISYRNKQFDREEVLAFYAANAVQGWKRIVDTEAEYIGVKYLNPIGECWYGDGLAMDELGRVWLLPIGTNPVLWANSGEDAIDRIVNWTAEDKIEGMV